VGRRIAFGRVKAIPKDFRGYTFAKLAEVRSKGSNYQATFADSMQWEQQDSLKKNWIESAELEASTALMHWRRVGKKKSSQAAAMLRNVPDSKGELNKTVKLVV